MNAILEKGLNPRPAINPLLCMGCTNCVVLCRKLGPNVLAVIDGTTRVVRPMNCITDGMCMLACPTQAIVLGEDGDGSCPAHAA
jgi:NAD-dependent dihydropyrimidine dehydrogenase PreA subunit